MSRIFGERGLFTPTRWPDIDFLFCVLCNRRTTHEASPDRKRFKCRCGTVREL